jgi:hypothetical protein
MPVSESVSAKDNQLVIIYDEPTPKDGPVVRLDNFSLISNVGGTTLTSAKSVTDIAHKIGDMIFKAGEGSDPQPTADTIKNEVVARLAIDLSNARILSYESVIVPDYNPFKEEKLETVETDKNTIEIKTTTTDYPFFAPEKETTIKVIDKPADPPEKPTNVENPPANTARSGSPDASSPDAGSPGRSPSDGADADASKPKNIHVTPADEAWVDEVLANEFLGVMDNFGKQTFATNAGAQAYLDYQLAKADIEIKTSSTGSEIVNAGAQDPAGVVSQLQSLGVTDEQLIDKVRAEVKGIIEGFEGSITALQHELSGLALNSAIDPMDPQAADSHDPDPRAQFSDLIAEWDSRFASQFNTDSPGDAGASEPLALDVVDGLVTMYAPHAPTTSSNMKISPSGLVVRAGLGTTVEQIPSIEDMATELAFNASSIVSVLDEAAWTHHA